MRNFLDEIKNRNIIYKNTEEDTLYEHLKEKRCGYIGFDITAPSLHVGNMLALLNVKRFADCGHDVIILLGGATTLLGDPSDKKNTRKKISQEEVSKNIDKICAVCRKILPSATIVNNYTWYKNMNFVDFMGEIGRYFSVNSLLKRSKIKERLENEIPINLSEFTYVMLQSYDFLYLYEKYNCTIQFGGCDQWSNITQGCNLIKKKIKEAKAFGITTHLFTDKNGNKIGKSDNATIWLDKNMLSPYDYWNFWRNIEDSQIQKYFLQFTKYSKEEILKISENINLAKKQLADEMTGILYNEHLPEIHKKIEYLFEKKGSIRPREIYTENTILTKILVEQKIFTSLSQAKSLIMQNAISVNNVKITNVQYKCEKGKILHINIGKKRKHIFLIK